MGRLASQQVFQRLLVAGLVAMAPGFAVLPGTRAADFDLSVEQLTFGEKHHFFGYIGQCRTIPWNASGRYILGLEIDRIDRMPKPDEAATIILIDTHDGNKILRVDKTYAWNPQQGTMFYWNPLRPETQFFFNDRGQHVKRVAAFVGSARKKHTYDAVRQFLDHLQSLGDVEREIIVLSDHQVGTCRECKLCFEKGEEYCPLKDDRDVLIEKMMAADGVVFATPNYSFHLSALMKLFLDRLGFVFHRPRFFGKTFTSVVTQGIYGGHKIVSYLDFVGNGLGFNTVKGSCSTAFEPMTEEERQKRDRVLARQSRRFYKRLAKPAYPVPTLFKLMAFRMGRTSMRLELDDASCDYRYYRDKGWFESDYYYPTRLGILKKAAGSLFDSIQTRTTRNRKR